MTLDISQFDRDYFERGSKSCYVNYAWLPEQTAAACHAMCLRLPIAINESIIDIGCAKGFYVAAFRLMLHRQCWGVDVSEYAISACHPAAKGYVTHSPDGRSLVWPGPYSWGIAKDSLEHCDEEETLPALLEDIARKCERLFVVVPLADNTGQFIARAEARDATHKLRKSGCWWKQKLQEYYKTVEISHLFPGLKDAWRFITGAHGFLIGRDSRAG